MPNFSSTSPRRSSFCSGSRASANGGGGARRNVAKIFLRQRNAFVGLHVAEDQKNGVVRHVVGFEERLNIGEVGGVEIGEIAIEIVGIGPIAKGDWRQIKPGKPAVGLVHDVDADFFFHNVALIAQVFVVHFEGAHAVGFEPQTRSSALEGTDS